MLKGDLEKDGNDEGDFEVVSCGVYVVNLLPHIPAGISVKSIDSNLLEDRKILL